MWKHCLLFSVLAASALQAPAYAQDDDDDDDGGDGRNSDCSRIIGDVTVRGRLNVTARCELSGTEIRGDVIVFAGGSLIARGARIRGNLEASRADFVELDQVRIDRNVSLQELVGDSSTIEDSDLRGSVVLTSNRSRFEILDNEFGRDLSAFGNTGGLRIAGNDIEGDLECAGNAPAPTVLGNRIEGDAEGQCDSSQPLAEPPEDPPPPRSTPPAPSPPPAAQPPAAQPPAPRPPAQSAPPAAAPTQPSTPAPAAPPPATPAPAAATPPATPPAEPALIDDGGAGAIGWPALAVLLPLLAWRRFRENRWQ